MLGEGRLEDVSQVAREFAREANADMGFKAIWWLAALAGEHNRYDGKVWDYQPVWGTGSALVELTPNPRKALDFEKEFDEGPGVAAEEQGTGVLMVEQHAHKALQYADRAIVMRRGRVELSLSGEEARSRIDEVEQAYMTTAASSGSQPTP